MKIIVQGEMLFQSEHNREKEYSIISLWLASFFFTRRNVLKLFHHTRSAISKHEALKIVASGNGF